MSDLEIGIPDHLAEITHEIEAEMARRISASPWQDAPKHRARLYGQYMAAAAELLSEQIGVVQASAIVRAYADHMLAVEARAIDSARALPAAAAS